MIGSIKAFLSGKKTILTAIAGMFTAAAAYGGGSIEFAQFVEALFIGAGAIFMRKGMDK
tara:strand:- start:7758 stop:7934 length:177 start_codon:yes stop_codon:yes gene_type:complete